MEATTSFVRQPTSFTGFLLALILLGTFKPATPQTVDLDLAQAQDPREWNDDDFVPFNGDRFDGFDWQLTSLLSRSSAGNMVLSPVGLKVLLAMLYEGAAENTAIELENTLQLPKPRQSARVRFSAILESLQAPNRDYVLDIASRMYVDSKVSPRQRFLKILKYFYNTDMEQTNFNDGAGSARKINAWVQGATNGRINNLVKGEDLQSSVLVLLNAIYFKGTWRHPFDEENTFRDRFQTDSGRLVDVNYMRQEFDSLYYYDSERLDAQIVRMPYMGNKFSMFVVLPNKPAGLPQLLNTINPTLVRQVMRNMTRADYMDVILPKFKFDFTAQLDGVLQQLGIRDLFSQRASLPGVASERRSQQLYVSNVLQKAGLEVTEKGTTAFATTEITLANKFGDPPVFNASHPFLFFIEDESTGTVLFVGKVADPSQGSQQTSGPSPGSGLVPRIGTTEPPVVPINSLWGTWPPRPAVATRTGEMPVQPQQPQHPQQPHQPQQPQVTQVAVSPFALFPAGTVPLQTYPRIVLYPVFVPWFK